MAKVTALKMDTITEKSGHQMTGMAVSVCLTPAAPSPVPIPYPTMGTVAEGIIDPCMRTKIEGAKVLTVGGCMKACHGNEPGTLKEVVSLNTAGPCFPWLGAPNVFIELGMAGITGSMGQMNKSITVGAGASASGAGGGGGGGGSAGGGAGGPGAGGPQGASNAGGGGGGSSQGAGPPNPPAPPGADGQATGGHPVDIATGTVFTSPAVDFQLPGPLWVSFVRTYRTSSVEHDVGLGRGWSHSLALRATRQGDRLVLVDETLRRTELAFPEGNTMLVLPYGRKLWVEQDFLVLDLNDGLIRVLAEVDGPGHYVLVQLRDAFGNAADLTWRHGELVEIRDAVGRRAFLEKNGPYRAWWVSVTDAEGREHRVRLVTYEIDERSDLVRVIDAGGAETRYVYDTEHYLVMEQRPDRVRFHFTYETIGGVRRCVETWGDLPDEDILAALGAPEAASKDRPRGIYPARFEYRPESRETVVIDAWGNRHVYIANAFGLMDRYIDPRGYVTSYQYDAAGRLTATTDGAGARIRAQVSLLGTVDAVYVGSERDASVQYDADKATLTLSGRGGSEQVRLAHGRPVEHVDTCGRRTRYEYDDRGLLTAITHPNGTQEIRRYDAHGNVIEVKGPTGATFTYQFDLLGRPTQIRNPDGIEYTLEYDSRGDLVVLRESTGRVTESAIDDARNVVRVRDSVAGTTEFRYVAGRMVEKREVDGSRFRFGYDADLRLRWIENPAGERYEREYDPAGNITRERFFSGQVREYQYDGSNLMVTDTRSDGSWARVERDALGRVVRRAHGERWAERFVYDGARLIRAETPDVVVTYEYDELGRRVAETQSTQGWTFTARRELDACGLIVGRTYSTGWGVAIERRPEDGAPTAMKLEGQSARTLRFEHDTSGREVRRWCADTGLAIETERDARGLPLRITLKGAGGEVLRARSYVWSPLGPLSEIHDERYGTRRYELDARGRVLSARGLGVSESFTYAAQGTPISAALRGAPLVRGGRPVRTEDAHLEWDARGRLCACLRADPARSFRYMYDDDDRLILAIRGDGVQFRTLYDAFGRRIAEISSTGESTWFGWDGESPVEEQTIGGPTLRRVFDDDGYTPLAETDAGGVFRLVACDAASTPWLYAGSADAIADLDLSTWGRVARQQGAPGPLRFAGQRADASTGLHYNRHRHYAPDLHVFLTPDPAGVSASIHDIGFVPNVTLYIDPSGLTTIIAGDRRDPVIRSSVQRLQREYPGARVIYHDQLNQPPSLWQRITGRNNRLDGETHVVVTTHGAPGFVQWGSGTVNGQQLGRMLNDAGFDGTRPGAKVDLIACNGATPPQGGTLRDSVAGGVARTTQAPTSGALSNELSRTWAGDTDTIPGVREVRDWPRFWRTRQEPTTYEYGPGMMSGTPNQPFIHRGQWVTYGPGVI